MVAITQDEYRPLMKAWQTEHDTTTVSSLRPPYDEVRGWRKEGRLVIPPNLALKCKIMFHIHDAVGPRHPDLSKTLYQTARLYWWPDMKAWVTKYVKNCEQCHHNPTTARTTSPSTTSLRSRIHEAQEQHHAVLGEWTSLHSISKETDEEQGGWRKEGRLVIPPDEMLKREILQLLHDAPTAGHPGRDETFAQVSHSYWWPGMRAWITDYVAGCAICQQNKNVTHRTRTPLYRIPTPENALTFQQVALDLITGLPPNGPHDSILTIVDHGCSRAAVFLPCATMVTGPGVAQLYFDNVYRWFGLPSKVISDRDPRFTSHFGRALANKIGAKQNLSTAFHPQTDGLSVWKNQWVEQYLRLIANAQQEDWSQWLTVATVVHNDHVNATLGTAPSEVLLGYWPTLHPDQKTVTNNQVVEQRLEMMAQRRAQVRRDTGFLAFLFPRSLGSGVYDEINGGQRKLVRTYLIYISTKSHPNRSKFGGDISKTLCQTHGYTGTGLARCFAYACTRTYPNRSKCGGDIAQISAHQFLLSSINFVIISTPQGLWE